MRNGEQLKPEKFQTKWKAEFNMGFADLEKIDWILRRIDEIGNRCRSGNLNLCIHYWSFLKQWWMHMKRFHVPHKHEDDIKKIEAIIDTGNVEEMKKVPNMLDELYLDLNDTRQKLGLGMPVTKNFVGVKRIIRE